MIEKYSKSVLVVDDDAADRKLIARLLRRAGFDVLETGNAESAMANVMTGRIGCVVADQIMPVSGAEVARSAQQVRGDITFIFMSGGGPKADLPEGATFVDKGDFDGIVRTAQECMEKFLLS